MMEWFQSFVEEVIAEYRELTARQSKTASWDERLAAIQAEQVFFPTFIGSVGEGFVEAVSKKKKYATARSPGSRSPADVWGVGQETGNVLHLSLLQVKATQKEHTPRSCRPRMKRNLPISACLWRRLLQSQSSSPAT